MTSKLAGLGVILPPRDPRDHPVPRLVTQVGIQRAYRYWQGGREVLDQGATSQCVAYAGKHLLMASPHRQGVDVPQQDIYDWCQQNDYWPGEDYDGTSVHALMKWLKANGYIESYQWATSVEQLHAHLMLRGPAVVGTTWTMDMFMPDRWDYIRPTGQGAGGHAWVIRGSNRNRRDPLTGQQGAFRMRNSWGRGWSDNGEAWISWYDMQTLIDDHGEIALPIERRR